MTVSKLLKRILIGLIRFYKGWISPLFPPSCRYYPTCSAYTIVAIEKHGPILGLIMGFSRILRCNPFVPGGIDYVPDKFSLRRNPDKTYREIKSDKE